MFMKGTPQFPMCGFSGRSCRFSTTSACRSRGVNVLDDMGIREGIKAFSNWPTIPQIYVKGEFVGGMRHRPRDVPVGELQQFLSEKGVPVKSAA